MNWFEVKVYIFWSAITTLWKSTLFFVDFVDYNKDFRLLRNYLCNSHKFLSVFRADFCTFEKIKDLLSLFVLFMLILALLKRRMSSSCSPKATHSSRYFSTALFLVSKHKFLFHWHPWRRCHPSMLLKYISFNIFALPLPAPWLVYFKYFSPTNLYCYH